MSIMLHTQESLGANWEVDRSHMVWWDLAFDEYFLIGHGDVGDAKVVGYANLVDLVSSGLNTRNEDGLTPGYERAVKF
ncbi:hypothetical protein N7523_005551 [Penicillium sp. IBT 18751x]|nr:hypothetical protein N7523_005864 [Penicillium sp. IBT 18751x]KAJ6117800.1 hypothetical protein N7523_005551 [Penicillium sp. IBT 18751x]